MRRDLYPVKKLLFSLLMVFIVSITNAQLVAWQFNTPASLGNEISYPSTPQTVGVENSTLVRGSGIGLSALGKGFSSNIINWVGTGTTKTMALADNDYFQVTVKAKVGYKLSLKTINATMRRSGAGCKNYRWNYSLDGTNFTEIGTADVLDFDPTAATDGILQPTIDLTGIAALQNLPSTTTVTLRIYVWGASSVGGSFAFGRPTTTYSLAIGGNAEALNEPLIAWQFGMPTSVGNESSWNATTVDAHINTPVLTRGAALVPFTLARGFTSNKGSLTVTTKSEAIALGAYHQFAIKTKTGYKASLASIISRTRRSSAGANKYQWTYSTDGSTFNDIDTAITFTSTEDGVTQPEINLTGIAALQNIPPNTTVTFRLYAWGYSSTGGTFAIGRFGEGETNNSIIINGTTTEYGLTTATSGDWNNTATWTNGIVPTAADPVFIRHSVTITSTTTVDDAYIQNNDTVNINNGQALNITGNAYNGGTINGEGNVVMNGVVAQTITGIGSINNFTYNNAAGVVLQDTLNIIGSVIPSAGVLTTNGKLVLNSSNTTTARITAGSNAGGYINGAVIAKKYIAGGGLSSAIPSKRAWRFFSHPFKNAIALNQLTNDAMEIDITGNGGTANGFTVNSSASAYWYNTTAGNGSTTNDVNGWIAYTAANVSTINDVNAWNKCQGVRIFIRGTKGQGLSGGDYTLGSPILSLMDTINTGDQTVNLVNAGANWNFVGNPFASPVNLQTVTRNNTSNMVYVWRMDLGTKGAYSPAIDISTSAYNLPAFSSFFVQATGTNPSIIFKETDKIATETTNVLFRNNATSITLQLKSNDDAVLWDELHFDFDQKFKTASEQERDGIKINNTEANLYSITSDSVKLSLDRRPLVDEPIQLGIKGNTSRTYKLVVSAFANNSTDKEFWLHDKYVETFTKLDKDVIYEFAVTNAIETQGDKRFELIKKEIKPTVSIVKNTIEVFPNPTADVLNIKCNVLNNNEPTIIQITDTRGIVVKTIHVGKVAILNKLIDVKTLTHGTYLVETVNGNVKQTTMFIKN